MAAGAVFDTKAAQITQSDLPDEAVKEFWL
jgi:hypothetical protein